VSLWWPKLEVGRRSHSIVMCSGLSATSMLCVALSIPMSRFLLRNPGRGVGWCPLVTVSTPVGGCETDSV